MKAIKYMWLLLFTFLLYTPVFADLSAKIEVSPSTVKVGENFEVIVHMNNTWTGVFEIDSFQIDGVDDFAQIWVSQTSKVLFVDWISQIETQKKYVFQSLKAGDFEIWPATITLWDETEVITKTQTLKVTEDVEVPAGLFVSKWPESKFMLDYSFFVIFLLVLFLIVFYYLLQSYLVKYQVKAPHIWNPHQEKKSLHPGIKKLDELMSQSESLSRSDFYYHFNYILREYLVDQWLKNAQNMAGTEIMNLKNSIDPKIIHIFEETYIREFKEIGDTQEQRISYIEALKKIIKK